jgi:hypothetical protein
MARENMMHLFVNEIEVPEGRRDLDSAAVKKLAASIKEVGLQHPITVRVKDDKYILVAGRHRLEAYRTLDEHSIPCIVSKWSKTDARLWEISENLHRAELTNMQRAEHIDEWRKLTAERALNSSTPGGRQPQEAGIKKTAAELGVHVDTVRNAARIATISPEAKQAASDAGVTSVRELKAVAAAPTPEAQIAKVHELKLPKSDDEVVNDQYNALVGAWNRASPEARERFRDYLDAPEFLRRA